LTVTAVTPPNMTGQYRKGAAAYSAVPVAAGGTTGTGTTGTGTTGTGTTSTEPVHSHGKGTLGMGFPSGATPNLIDPGVAFSAASELHQHTITGDTADAGAHDHDVPGLSVPGLSVPALGVGSLDMAHVDVLTYFRR
jgi:hypothetical protein